MERIAGLPAVRGGVGERADHCIEFQDGARPAMGHQQGKGVSMGRTDMQEMNAQAVDLGPAAVPLVESGFSGAPVVVVLPVLDQRAHPLKLRTLADVGDGLRVRPAGPGQAYGKVVELCLRDVNGEVLNAVGHHRFPCTWVRARVSRTDAHSRWP
jgi:hypothetical protein